MNTELVASPRIDDACSVTTVTREWHTYAVEIRRLLTTVIEVSGAGQLEVEELVVSRPLPVQFAELRNGSRVESTGAGDLVVGMAVGEGPYCRLIDGGRLRIESGWDGAVHFFLASEAAEELTGFRSEVLELGQRMAVPEPTDVENPVRSAADEAFWGRVREELGGVTLLCERWAHGAYGCRWFRVTSENLAEVAGVVRPRSLVSVVIDPDMRLDLLLLDDDFTAFRAALAPGELAYRAYPGGADALTELTDDGFTLMLGESALAAWCAVVPDPDGVVRGQWEAFEAL
jgi:hypothetical protein